MIVTVPEQFWSEKCAAGIKVQLHGNKLHNTWLNGLGLKILVTGVKQLNPGDLINIIGNRGTVISELKHGQEVQVKLILAQGPRYGPPRLQVSTYTATLASLDPILWQIDDLLVLDEDVECISF